MQFGEILRHFRQQWGKLAGLATFAVIAAAAEAVVLVLLVGLAKAVTSGDEAVSKSLGPFSVELSRNTLTIGALLAVAVSVVAALTTNWLRAVATKEWLVATRTRVVDGFLGADWSLQAAERPGHLHAVFGYVEPASFVLQQTANAARGLFGVVVLVGTALLITPLGALGLIVLGSALFVVLRPLDIGARRLTRERTRAQKELSESVAELGELARDIRVFDAEPTFAANTGAVVEDLSESERKLFLASGALAPVYQGGALAAIVVVLAIASRWSLDVAVLGAVSLLLLRSVSYGQTLQSAVHYINAGTPHLTRLDEAFAAFDASAFECGTESMTEVQTIGVDDVSMRYPDGNVGLGGVTLELHRGEIVGIVGASGAGKSTLAQLLLGLRKPTSGAVLANGQPVDAYTRTSWCRQVTLVPQETRLVHGSVFDNIAFFRNDVDRDAVVSAAKAAGIHDTISELPDGYETPIGASVRGLSGGEVQRIGIARALAGSPSMVVLDEPTSGLDPSSEAIVLATLEQLRSHALVVVIAHRVSTLSVCDRVVVLERGAIEADGSLEDAAERSPSFKRALRTGTLDDAQAEEDPVPSALAFPAATRGVLVVLPHLPDRTASGIDLRHQALVRALGHIGDVHVFGLCHRHVNPSPPWPGVVTWTTSSDPDLTPARLAPSDAEWMRRPDGHPSDAWHHPTADRELAELVEALRPHTVVLGGLSLHAYVGAARRAGATVVLDEANVEADIADANALLAAESRVTLFRRLLAERTAQLEAKVTGDVDQVWVCSDHDAERLAERFPDTAPVSVVPNVLASMPDAGPRPDGPPLLLYPGSFGYPPNADAARWLADEILPVVHRSLPDARLVLAGADPPADLADRSSPAISVTGPVDDMTTWFRAATALPVALRAGAGTRLKILEAFSHRVPVVSTSKGFEGLDVEAGVHLLAADSTDDIAAALVELHTDQELVRSLVEHGSEVLESRYTLATMVGAVRRTLPKSEAGSR